MKICFKCQKEKDRSEFYKHAQMGDGLLGKCKECTRKDSSENLARRMQEPEFRVKEAERCRKKSYEREKKLKAMGIKHDPVKRREYLKKSYEKYPLKHIARTKVATALANGTINRFPCVKCGAINSEAHHEDYTKPLDVIWYCPKHHGERHVEINDEKRLAGIK